MKKAAYLLAVAMLLLVAGVSLANQAPVAYLPIVVKPADVSEPPAGCNTCAFNAYNCGDFATQADAQACYDFCFEQVGFDVHQLDADMDGEACESLP